MRPQLLFLLLALLAAACGKEYRKADSPVVREAQALLDQYAAPYVEYEGVLQEEALRLRFRQTDSASYWKATTAFRRHLAEPHWLAKASELLANPEALAPLQRLQLSQLVYWAARHGSPADIDREIVSQRQLLSLRRQVMAQLPPSHGYTDKERPRWEARAKLALLGADTLRRLAQWRNEQAVQAGYPNYFGYQSDAYLLAAQEAADLRQAWLLQVRPLFDELHKWVRYALADQYKQGAVPLLLPAHWVPFLEGYPWSHVRTPFANMLADSLSRLPQGASLQRGVEEVFLKWGFPALPASAYEYLPAIPQGGQAVLLARKNALPKIFLQPISGREGIFSFASAYATAQAAQAWGNPDVPMLLRRGACPAMPDAWARALQAAAHEQLTQPFAPADSARSAQWHIAMLLEEALQQVPALVYYAGVLGNFEQALYAGSMPPNTYARRWWGLQRRYLGIEAPASQWDAWGGPNVLPPLISGQGASLDSAFAIALHYQYGQLLADTAHLPAVWFRRMLYPGASLTWREVQADAGLEYPSMKPLMAHFAPLLAWLRQQNRGRASTLPPWELDVSNAPSL